MAVLYIYEVYIKDSWYSTITPANNNLAINYYVRYNHELL